MQMPSNPPSRAARWFRKKVIRLGSGKLYHEFTSSGTITKAALLQLVRNADPTYASIKANQVDIKIRCIGGGGGGGYGASVFYGGFPAAVNTERFSLDDLPDSISFVVGAGGAPAGDGGSTTFWDVVAIGGKSGSTGSAEDSNHSFMESNSLMRMGRRSLSNAAPSSPFGPGGGGYNSSSIPAKRNGGSSSSALPNARVIGPTANGAVGFDASDANDRGFDSFGTGGAGNSSTVGGGNGGKPGGGGGATSQSSFPSTGYGARGGIYLQFTVTEAA